MAFCLSLFIHPCASSPDQLRQEEPHAHWGHLSLLFTDLTKAARVFPGCRWPAFHLPASIRTSAEHTSLETWNREGETAKTAIILTHFKCVVSCASVNGALDLIPMRNKAVIWKTGCNCFNTAFFPVCFGLEMLMGQTTLMHNTTARVWERLVVWWCGFAVVKKYKDKNWVKSHRMCGTLFCHRQHIKNIPSFFRKLITILRGMRNSCRVSSIPTHKKDQ